MGCFSKCDPCCRRVGCSCTERSGDLITSIDKNRSCTDIPCILIFIIFLVYLVVAVWFTAFDEGDPDRIIYGVDYSERICGKSAGVKNKPYAFWPDITSFRFKVCTNDCDQATFTDFLGNNIKINNIAVGYHSEAYLGKYCKPTTSGISISNFDSGTSEIQRYMGDVKMALPIIMASIGIAFFFSFFYIFLMRLCIGILVWTTVAAIIIGGALLGFVFVQKANDSELSTDESNLRKGVGYAAWVITGIFFLIILFCRNRIRIAIQVIKSAGRSIADMPMMVLFPFWPLSVIIGFFIAWMYASIFIFSAGSRIKKDTPSDFIGQNFAAEESGMDPVPSQYQVIGYDKTIQNSFAPHFFLLLWVVQIGIYFTFTTIAGSVANWYFTKRGENGKKLRGNGDGELVNSPVFSSCKRTCRYHIGSILYAACIIAIIQFIRWCVRYAERMMGAGGKEPNKIQKLLFKIVDCFLWCLECCLDKISKNALIWMSIYGDAFCPSVCGSFKLIWTNLMRVAVITVFSAIITLLGKILIPLLTVALCGLILINVDPYKSELSSPVMPLILIFVLSLAIAFLFLTIYDTAIDTIFMCFLIDEKCNKASGAMLADPGLRDIVQKYEKESKKLAASMQRNPGAANAVEISKNNNNKDITDETIEI